MYTPSYYIDRAAELESLAKGITDLATRSMCLDLAQRFRNIAQMKSMTNTQPDKEVERLAERMVGQSSPPAFQAVGRTCKRAVGALGVLPDRAVAGCRH